MSFTIFGLGTALPETAISQNEGLGIARVLGGPDLRDASWLPSVYLHSGIDRRHQVIGRAVVDDVLTGARESGSVFLPSGEDGDPGPTTGERMAIYAAEAPPLAIRAAKSALAQSGFDAASITQLVTVSCTGFAAPGVDFALINALSLSPTVERTHVGFMGCHGAMNGVRVVNAFAAADPSAVVLLVAVELCSIHYHYGKQPDKVVANALFADGAAAIVGKAAAGRPWRVAATGSCLMPNSAKAMGWLVGDHGFEMSLSKKIPDLIATKLRPWIEAWLGDNGLSLDRVGSWAVHPGGPKILSAVEEGLTLPPDALAASRGVLAECGNMSSPTVLFIVERLRNGGAALPCVSLGFGPGLVAEAVLWM